MRMCKRTNQPCIGYEDGCSTCPVTISDGIYLSEDNRKEGDQEERWN